MSQFHNPKFSKAHQSELFYFSEAQEKAWRDSSSSLRELENIAKQIVLCLGTRFEISEKINRDLETLPQRTLRLIGFTPSGPALSLADGHGGAMTTALEKAIELVASYHEARKNLVHAHLNGAASVDDKAKAHVESVLQDGDEKFNSISSFITKARKVCEQLTLASDQRTQRQLRREFNQAVEDYRKVLRS